MRCFQEFPALTSARVRDEPLWADPGAGPEGATASRRGSRASEKVGAAGAGEGWEEPADRGANPGRRGDAGREGGTCGRESERHKQGRRGRRALRSEPGASRRRQPGHGPPSVPAQATRPPGRGADGPTDGSACRRRPAMFSRSSRKRLSSRSVSVPPPERGRSLGPPGPRRAPLPSFPPPGGRAPVAPGKLAPRAGARPGRAAALEDAEGVKSGNPFWARPRPRAVALCVTVWGPPGKPPP